LIVAGLLPLALFFFFSALLASRLDPDYGFLLAVFLDDNVTIGTRAVKAVIALLGLTVLAYVFTTLGTRLRLFMEGQSWPAWLRDLGVARHVSDLRDQEREIQNVKNARERVVDGEDQWIQRLLDARLSEPKANDPCLYPPDHPTRLHMEDLARLKACGRRIPAEQLEEAVVGLVALLRDNTMTRGVQAADRLDHDHTALRELIEYSERQLRRELIDLETVRQFNYGAELVAPTAMGNVAESIRSYAWSRYEMNLDVFWPRLQKVMQSDSGFYTVLSDAKVQLDFFVSVFWLAILYVVVWVPVLAVYSPTLWPYLAVAFFGPLVAIAAYHLAVHNYLAFAELMRSAIDTYRLKLLEALQMPSPAGTAQEGRMWRAINKRMAYGESFPLAYVKKDGS
jgi:hypothetical protein